MRARYPGEPRLPNEMISRERMQARPPHILLTNYAMLEVGQPLHAFDLALLKGPGIVVRRATPGETLVTLDGVERTFTADDLLICDAERAVAVAGVMGGELAEVSEQTADILAHMLSKSKHPAGTTELPAGAEALAQITFKALKP